jgi:hypothetical protein
MRIYFFLVLLISLLTARSNSQDFSYPALKGFKTVMDYPVYVSDNLWDFINGAADNYLAYDFVDLHVAEYKKGREVIKLEVYKHEDNIMAFGIYSSERSPSFNFRKIGAQGYIIDGAINFFKGNYYVKIRTYSNKPKTIQAAESLAYRTAEQLQGISELPADLSLFPAEGKKENEETYINRSVLGHNFLNGAFRTLYQSGSDNFSVFIFLTGSHAETVKTINSYLASAGMDPDKQTEGRYAFNDGYNGNIFLAWKDEKIVLISGLAKDQSGIADKYISGILK